MIRSTTLSALAFAALLTGTAAAQNPPAPPPKPAQTKPAKSAMTTHAPAHRVREAHPGYLKMAKVNADSAEKVAVATAAGTVTSRKIEKDKGVLVYKFDIKQTGQEGYQAVTIDANTGAMVSNNHVAPKAKPAMKPAGAKPAHKPAKPDSTKKKPPQQ
jgi:hypothetical protein